jgi:hypothetical protein
MESWKDAGLLTDPGKRPFSAEEIRLNPVKQELAEPGLTMGEILDKRMAANLAHPAFIGKARTVAGAERAAVRLGVKSANYAASLDIGNDVNKALKMLEGRGLPVPDHVRVSARAFETWKAQGLSTEDPAALSIHKRTGETYLVLNPTDDYWSHPQMVADHQHGIGYWSTNHKYHAVLHECGHAAHHQAAPTLYASLAGKKLTAQEAAIAAKVSEYAVEDAREFVAEVFAALAAGVTMDADVYVLYVALGGKPP